MILQLLTLLALYSPAWNPRWGMLLGGDSRFSREPFRALGACGNPRASQADNREVAGTRRDVLVLCDIGGATSPVAAKMLGVSKARVRTTLYRARAKLREELGPILEPIAYKQVMRESDATLDSALIQ